MSQLEVATVKSPVCYFDFPAMAAGTTSATAENASAITNFSAQCSKILGVSLLSGTGAGAVNATVKEVLATAGALFPVVVLSSSNNTDTAVYRMYFVNEQAVSPYLTIKPC